MTIKPPKEGEEYVEYKPEPHWDKERLPEDDEGGEARRGKTTFREQLLNTLKMAETLLPLLFGAGQREQVQVLKSRISRDIKELELRRDLHL